MTATQTQIRRDSYTNLNAATPAAGELGCDTTNNRIVVGDGSKAGGHRIPSWKDLQNQAFVAVDAGGTADAITITLNPVPTAYAAYQRFVFKAASTNTTSATINVNALGAKTLKKRTSSGLSNLAAGDIQNGAIYGVVYDGTYFQVEALSGISITDFPAGTLVNRAYGEYTSNADLATTIPDDDTLPQNTEGTEIITASITPKSVTNRLRVRFSGQIIPSSGTTQTITAALFQDSTASALTGTQVVTTAGADRFVICFEYEYVPATLSALTLKIRVGSSSGTMRMNGTLTTRKLGGAMRSTLIIEEIVA